MTSVVIEDAQATQYASALAADFPAVQFYDFAEPEELMRHLPELHQADVLMTKGGAIRADVVSQLPALAWVQSLIAGIDRFMQVLESRPGVLLTSVRGMHGEQMAEMALTQMLVLARDVPQIVRNQQCHTWQRWPPSVLRGKCATIVGLGTSGSEIGLLCKALGMRVAGVSRSTCGKAGFDEIYGYGDFLLAVAKADFLILAASYRSDTDRLVNAEVLTAMKPTAFLINISRGAVVDEDALAQALADRVIAGAGLDVFQVEPLPASSPLWDSPNVFLTPHMAGMSERYVDNALRIIRANLNAYLAGDFSSMINLI